MEPHLIATLKDEETFTFKTDPKHLIFLVYVLHKLRCFFHEIFELLEMFQTSDFVVRMDILSSKLEVSGYIRRIQKVFLDLETAILKFYRKRTEFRLVPIWSQSQHISEGHRLESPRIPL